MGIKILVTGPFSTGKTETVADVVAAMRGEGTRVVMVPDTARSCPLPLNEEQTLEASVWLAMTQIAREIEASAQMGDVVICDRGVPDILTHSDDVHGATAIHGFGKLRPFLVQWCDTYDLILISAINESISIVPDGLRSQSLAYRTKLGERSRAVLAEFSGGVALPFGRPERLAYALAAIRPLLAAQDGSR